MGERDAIGTGRGGGLMAEILVALPTVCGHTDVQLAHELMRRHRACRVGRCMWKAAAHRTLVLSGQLAPQSKTPRERAAERGIEFPAPQTGAPRVGESPALGTLREVLDRLTKLGLPGACDGNFSGEEQG